jgi:hypothetical protein
VTYVLSIGLSVVTTVVTSWAVTVVRLRRGNAGARPIPGWLLTAEHLSPDVRVIVGKVARASVKDLLAEWDTLPPALQVEIQYMVDARVRQYAPLRTPQSEDQNRKIGDSC